MFLVWGRSRSFTRSFINSLIHYSCIRSLHTAEHPPGAGSPVAKGTAMNKTNKDAARTELSFRCGLSLRGICSHLATYNLGYLT